MIESELDLWSGCLMLLILESQCVGCEGCDTILGMHSRLRFISQDVQVGPWNRIGKAYA